MTVTNSIATGVTSFFTAIPFSSATWIVLAILAFFVWLFAKAQRDPNSRVDWEDLFITSETERVSPYKLGFMVGMIVSTWVVIKFADANMLTWDIFGGYLAYLLGGAGWAATLKSKENSQIVNAGGAVNGRPAFGNQTPADMGGVSRPID